MHVQHSDICQSFCVLLFGSTSTNALEEAPCCFILQSFSSPYRSELVKTSVSSQITLCVISVAEPMVLCDE